MNLLQILNDGLVIWVHDDVEQLINTIGITHNAATICHIYLSFPDWYNPLQEKSYQIQ